MNPSIDYSMIETYDFTTSQLFTVFVFKVTKLCTKWTSFSLWKKLLAFLLAVYARLLGPSPFPSALKYIFWKLGVTHILKILHLILTVHGNRTWKYIISRVTSLKRWKNLPFSSSLVFWLSFSFSEVTR